MQTNGYVITKHAESRMHSRSITKDNIECVLNWGRKAYLRGARVYCLGKKEIERIWKETKIKMSSLEGIQVVCDPMQNTIITVYKNKDFKHSLRENRKHRSYR